jgi:hypothetical protein
VNENFEDQEEADINDLEDLLDDSDEKYFYSTKVTIMANCLIKF